jgi:hypothetical protein
MLVASNTIVEALDVIKDVWLSLSPRLVNPFLDFFTLQVNEEQYGHSVSPTVAAKSHAWTQSVIFAPTIPNWLP